MYLLSENFNYNIHGTIQELNRLGVQRFVFQFSRTYVANMTIVIFRFESYPDYLYFCEKTKTTPITPDEFFV